MRFLLLSLLFSWQAAASPLTLWERYATPESQAKKALLSAQQHYRSGSFDVALEQATIARRLAPSIQTDYLYALSLFRSSVGNASVAKMSALCAEVGLVLRSVRLQHEALGSTTDALLILGFCAAILGDLETARQESLSFARAPAASLAEKVTGYINLGDTYMALLDLPRAISSYNEAISLGTSEPYAFFALAVAHWRNYQEAEAQRALQSALSLDPGASTLSSQGVFFIPEEDIFFFQAVAAAGQGDMAFAQHFLGEYLIRSPEGPYHTRAREAFYGLEAFVLRLRAF